MAAATSNEDKTSLKVMIHKQKNKVIFAEADGKFVNTLFSLLTLPIGTLARVLERCSDRRLNPLKSLQNLYRSLVELPVGYFTTEESKFMMLNPRTSLYDRCRMLKLNIDDTEPTRYFRCENEGCNKASGSYFTTCSVARCPYCRKVMTREIKCGEIYGPVNEFRKDGNVFVPNLITFIVTDDLRVMPSTLDLSLKLLCDFGLTDASHVEERTIDIGCEQILILVKAAILLKYPLTYLIFHSIHPITRRGLVNPKLGTLSQHLTCNEKGTNLKTMTLRVTLQKSTSKFLFAEAREDFVEFLFGFLEIPLGTLIRKLMNGNTSLECLENVYASISNVYFGVDCDSSMLSKPALAWKYVSANQIFPLDVSSDSTDIYQRTFPDGTLMRYIHGLGDPNYIMRFKDPRVQGRFLLGVMKFILTDDLIVTPFSSVSAIAIMNKLKVPLKDVEHHEVSIGIEKGLELLNASLKSNSTLTDVLLKEIIKKKERPQFLFQSSTLPQSVVGHQPTAQSPPQSVIGHQPTAQSPPQSVVGPHPTPSSTRLTVKKTAPKRKAAKDPKKPKRPASAFFIFMEDFRKQVQLENEYFMKQFQRENPGKKSVQQVDDAGGARWKSLSDYEKAVYFANAERRKKQYKKDIASYHKNKRLAGGGYDDDDDDDDDSSEVNDEEGSEEDEECL